MTDSISWTPIQASGKTIALFAQGEHGGIGRICESGDSWIGWIWNNEGARAVVEKSLEAAQATVGALLTPASK